MAKNESADKEPYFYWYEFLKRSAVYKKCCESGGRGKLSRLYTDFGNVHEIEWQAWWNEHQSIFTDPAWKPWYLHRLESADDFQTYNDEYGVSITVNLFEPKGKLIKEFSKMLDEVMVEEDRPSEVKAKPRGRPKFSLKEEFDGYQLAAPPHIRSLARALKVYDAWHGIKDLPRPERDTLYDIGKKLKLSEGFVVTGADDPERIDKKNKMTATTSRYYRQAVKIIENVEKGIFPKNS